MLTGMLAVQNILGEQHDLWEVNTERSYYEEFTKEEMQSRAEHEDVHKPDHPHTDETNPKLQERAVNDPERAW